MYFSCRTVTSFIRLRGRRSKEKGEEESRSEKRDLREREVNGSKSAFVFITPSHNKLCKTQKAVKFLSVKMIQSKSRHFAADSPSDSLVGCQEC